MKDVYNIRIGKTDDILKIAEIFVDSVSNLCKEDYSPDVIAQWITSISPESRLKHIENKSLWVAEVNGKIRGYLVSVPGEILSLFVGSSSAGLGIGTALFRVGIEIAKKDWSAELKLESTITAAPFYRKLGFREVNRGFYTHGISDLNIAIINMVFNHSPRNQV